MKAKHKHEYARVPMPATNVSTSKIGNYEYVYHIGKGYRNQKGQATSDRTAIGKKSGDGMLIPNENYFAIYETRPEDRFEIDAILNFGDFFLLDAVAKETELARVLSNVFGSAGDEILLLAIYMVLTGQALYRCEGWCRETLTGRGKAVTSQRCSRLLTLADEPKRMEFFRAWVHARQQHEYLAYDVTSISSYARGNDVVEYGYNRDHEQLPQINLGMYYGEESMLPIFYCTYKGSIVDKSHMQYMMKYNERLGIEDVCFVMDRGFYTEENVKSIAFQYRFIVGMSNHLVLSKELIASHGQTVMSSRYDIGLTGAKGIAIEDERYGFRCKIHLFHSNEKIADEERILKAKLSRWEEELREGKQVKKAEDYFDVTMEPGQKKASVARKHDMIDERIRNLGYFLMMTTDLNKSPTDILDIYRRKDVIEKSFDDLKNGLDMKRLRVHSEAAMDGKMFIAFIGLILKTFIHNKLRDYLAENNSVSLVQVFDELRMIKTVKTANGLAFRSPITKRQRKILECFGKTEDDLDVALQKYAGPRPYFDLEE